MFSRNVVVVNVLGFAISCGILFGDSVYCPPNCDCEVAKSSTKDCTTGVTQCSGVEPIEVFNPELEENIWYCADAVHVQKLWPRGSEKSSWRDVYGVAEYDNRTNCNEVNTNCSRPTECEYVGQKCQSGAQYGSWTDQLKIVQVNCQAQ